ncbi:hypothetical protein J6590_033321 [Homalodisca vitripennis]|nr:hypothetical protein J6590_033321 [Homalodisca vitripennis]
MQFNQTSLPLRVWKCQVINYLGAGILRILGLKSIYKHYMLPGAGYVRIWKLQQAEHQVIGSTQRPRAKKVRDLSEGGGKQAPGTPSNQKHLEAESYKEAGDTQVLGTLSNRKYPEAESYKGLRPEHQVIGSTQRPRATKIRDLSEAGGIRRYEHQIIGSTQRPRATREHQVIGSIQKPRATKIRDLSEAGGTQTDMKVGLHRRIEYLTTWIDHSYSEPATGFLLRTQMYKPLENGDRDLQVEPDETGDYLGAFASSRGSPTGNAIRNSIATLASSASDLFHFF